MLSVCNVFAGTLSRKEITKYQSHRIISRKQTIGGRNESFATSREVSLSNKTDDDNDDLELS